MTDLTKAPDQTILDLINADNSTSLTLGLVTYGLPTVAAGETPVKNTELTVTAAEGSGYTGSQVVQYNRISLATIPVIADVPATYQLGDALTIADIIDEINAMYGINMVAADYVDAPMPVFTGEPNEEHTVQLVAAADSLIYIGSMVLTLKSADIELSSVITITSLSGLTYEAPVAP